MSGVVQSGIYLVFLVQNYDVIRRDLAMYRYMEEDGDNGKSGTDKEDVQVEKGEVFIT